MTTPEARLAELGHTLPAPARMPPGVHLPFSLINIRGARAFFSGHPRQDASGAIDGPYGLVGADLATAEAARAAEGIALSVLANLRAEIGSLDRIAGWGRVFGMVASAPGYTEQHLVLNGFSDLIIAVFGAETGRHARSAVGVAGLPMNFAIEIEGEVLLRPG
ncbi:MAG: RidA family protein [Pseudomonadota bacterium]